MIEYMSPEDVVAFNDNVISVLDAAIINLEDGKFNIDNKEQLAKAILTLTKIEIIKSGVSILDDVQKKLK